MDKTYNPRVIEEQWYQTWESQGYFPPTEHGKHNYCIMLPPPNVTGSLHMGHAFQQTLMDVLIRYHRMNGDSTLWQCGTDHAGIATQIVVERQLEMQGKSRIDLGREKFTEAVWKWKETSGNTITRQSRRLGTSMDWSRERFTMDPGLSKAVTEVFISLYEEGLIYRGKRLVNWDPVLHTAISDLEVISEEESGHLWHIRYPHVEGKGYIVVATTRPETMLGDSAVAVHPDDKRYQDLIGKQVVLPLTGRNIPVIADEYVDPEFGSGCVKITPAHDFNDYEIGERHNLPLLNIFTHDAHINENGPEAYQGMERYQARKQIITDLKAQDLVEKIEPYKFIVPRGDRSGAIVEPYLTDQWYVRIQPLADPAIKAVENGDIKFVPDNWSKTYFEWMRNIQDWCISRQLWWGHRIPAWYDEQGNVFVGRDEDAIREQYDLGNEITLNQDEDVLDTWFSSALWPFSTLGWPEKTAELKNFYPSNVLVTGFDIIFFWVARMIMMGLKFMDNVPFKEVYITGLIRDEHGQKMSKSKGNILDPLDLIDGISQQELIAKRTKDLMRPQNAPAIERATRTQFPEGIQAYGTDALRFTFASLASNTRNINFDIGRIGGYRNFCNKLWNAARFVLMSVEGKNIEPVMEHSLGEKWILSKLESTKTKVNDALKFYRFDLAVQSIYQFTWNDYCDWYLEYSKVILSKPDIPEQYQSGTRYVLASVLETILRLSHPFIPFITEEIWQRISPILGIKGKTIMLQAYPTSRDVNYDEASVTEFEWIKEFILGIRRIRGEMNIAPGKQLKIFVKDGNPAENAWLQANTEYLIQLGRLEKIEVVADEIPDAATALAGEMTLYIPLQELIDPKTEIDRLSRDLETKRMEFERSQQKLSNKDFVERAPEEIVNKEKQRSAELNDIIGKIQHQINNLQGLLKTEN